MRIVRQRQHVRIAHAKIDLRWMENKNTDNQHQGIRNRQLERTSEEMFLNRSNNTSEGQNKWWKTSINWVLPKSSEPE